MCILTVIFYFLWTRTSLTQRSLLNSLKPLQHLEKSPDCWSLSSCDKTFFPLQQLFFFCTNASVLSVWYSCARRALWLHTFTSHKQMSLTLIFVIIEVYIFIQRFGLYSGPVTDCTFVGSLLSKSPQQNPHSHACPLWGLCWYLNQIISWHLLSGPGIQCVSLSAFPPGW